MHLAKRKYGCKYWRSSHLVYAVKGSNPDMPSFNKAVSREFSDHHVKAMNKEISALIHQNTWITVPHSG